MSNYVNNFQKQTDNWKDKVQYGVATTSFISGVGMGFLSFLTSGTLSGEILGFIGECFTLTGGIFGITLYIRNKVAQAGTYIIDSAKQMFAEHEDKYNNDENTDDNNMAEKAQ